MKPVSNFYTSHFYLNINRQYFKNHSKTNRVKASTLPDSRNPDLLHQVESAPTYFPKDPDFP